MPRQDRQRSQPAFRLALAAALCLAAGCALPQGEDRAQLFNEDGIHLFANGDYQNALESFDLALTLRPQDPGLLYNVAQCYDRLGDVRKAEVHYGYCLVQDPKHADARLALVELCYRTGRRDQAGRLVADYLKDNPTQADALVLDARRLREERALPQAQGRLQQALDHEPQNRRALTELAVIYEDMKMPERAYVLYERVLAREPGQAEIKRRVELLQTKGVRRPALE